MLQAPSTGRSAVLDRPAVVRPISVTADDVGRWLRRFLIALWVVSAAAGLGFGWQYYRLPLAERAFAERHALLAPTGLIGHSLGIAGSLMMTIGVIGYTLRKRVRLLHAAGRLKYWLQVHIFLCTLGPFFVLLHTSFRFGGIVSIAFWSMTAVVISGVFGRYVYVRIPTTIHGQFRTLESIERQRTDVVETIGAHAGVPPETVKLVLGRQRLEMGPGLMRSIVGAIRFDLGRRSRNARLKRILESWKVPVHVHGRLLDVLQRQADVEQQIQLLQPFQKLFRYWHVFHLPLAVLMFLILIVHVAVAAMFGYAWPHP